AGTNVIALQPSLVLYADGGMEIDASQEASLQMDSAPMAPADANTVYVSLWQTNSVGLRAERFVNWAKANANAVKYLTAAAWPAPTGTMGLAGGKRREARGNNASRPEGVARAWWRRPAPRPAIRPPPCRPGRRLAGAGAGSRSSGNPP